MGVLNRTSFSANHAHPDLDMFDASADLPMLDLRRHRLLQHSGLLFTTAFSLFSSPIWQNKGPASFDVEPSAQIFAPYRLHERLPIRKAPSVFLTG